MLVVDVTKSYDMRMYVNARTDKCATARKVSSAKPFWASQAEPMLVKKPFSPF